MRKLSVFILVFAALAALVYFGLPHFVWPPGGSTSGKSIQCKATVKGLAQCLQDYAESNGGARPETLEALAEWHTDFSSVPRCPFHDAAEHSYVYFPPGQSSEDQDGMPVILYCTAPHPETVNSADGETGESVVSVVRPDLTIEFIPVKRFKVSIKDRAAVPVEQPIRIKVTGISLLTKEHSEVVFSDAAAIQRALTFFPDFAVRETKETQPAEDHVPDYRVLLIMRDGSEVEIHVCKFSWEWSNKWFPVKRGWPAFLMEERTNSAGDLRGILPASKPSSGIALEIRDKMAAKSLEVRCQPKIVQRHGVGGTLMDREGNTLDGDRHWTELHLNDGEREFVYEVNVPPWLRLETPSTFVIRSEDRLILQVRDDGDKVVYDYLRSREQRSPEPPIHFAIFLEERVASEISLEEFVTEIERARDTVADPLADVRHESAGVRYWAVYQLEANKSEDQEAALVRALEDEVQWVRFAAAVQLGKAGRQADKVAPILVEALGGEEATFHLWGTRHVFPALYKIGAQTLPHLALAIDHPNERLRQNGCEALRGMTFVVKDRQSFQKPLAALDAAIAGHAYPASQPMYIIVRMKIDGDAARADKLLRELAKSKDVGVRVATLREIRHFAVEQVPDWIVPLLGQSVEDNDPRVVRAAISALFFFQKLHDDIDVSSAVPVIERQLKKQNLDRHLRDYMLRFLRSTNGEIPFLDALRKALPDGWTVTASKNEQPDVIGHRPRFLLRFKNLQVQYRKVEKGGVEVTRHPAFTLFVHPAFSADEWREYQAKADAINRSDAGHEAPVLFAKTEAYFLLANPSSLGGHVETEHAVAVVRRFFTREDN